ncbi:MAG: hypothetical protein IJL87_09865 [Clostridia bacterium]|nr:hypothetical protein [Clostridia bacterium]
MKKLFAIIICIAVILSTAACGFLDSETAPESKPESAVESVIESAVESIDPLEGLEKYTSKSGLSLYMKKGYAETELEGVACYFQGIDSAVSCSKETNEILEAAGLRTDYTLEEYAQLVATANGFDCTPQTDDYGNVFIVYEKNIDGNDFTYYAYFKTGKDAYWTCNFICLKSDTDKYADDFALWASTIEIA